MNQMIWLRRLGVSVAVALLAFATLGFFDDLARPNFRASDLFSGRLPSTGTNALGSVVQLFSFDGDFLADQAAVRAAEVLYRPAIDAKSRTADNKAAQDALLTALKLSPIRPALWLTLGTLRAQTDEPVTPALKMSYLTGSVPVEIAFSRIQTVTSTSVASDEEIRLLAQSDIRSMLANRSRFEAPLVAVYVQATPAGKSLLMEATKASDPKFSETLRRY